MSLNLQPLPPSRPREEPLARARVFVALGIGTIAAAFSLYFWSLPHDAPSDFAQIWAGSRALLQGDNPYGVVGPDKSFNYRWRTPYPLPAFLIGIPASLLPLFAANALFAGCGAAALAWSLTRTRLNDPRLLVFASFAYLHAAQASQWSPLLTAAALTPGLAFVLAAKPTIGAALWIAYPSLRSASLIVSTLVVSLLVRPSWIWEWWPTLSDLTHLVAPIQFWGGPLILLALLKWRLPEARLIAALACVPQSTFMYDALPLFLVVKRAEEGAALCGLMLVAHAIWDAGPKTDFTSTTLALGQWIVWFVYLPCVVMVLRRPVERHAR
jgi:hypothetical protein